MGAHVGRAAAAHAVARRAWIADEPARHVTQVQRGELAGYSVRTDRWRYTEWDHGKQGSELYDHNSDPGEYYNLVSNPKHVLTIESLKKILRQLS